VEAEMSFMDGFTPEAGPKIPVDIALSEPPCEAIQEAMPKGDLRFLGAPSSVTSIPAFMYLMR
jgi:hypothetical protein